MVGNSGRGGYTATDTRSYTGLENNVAGGVLKTLVVLMAAYGLGNSNAKRQDQIDSSLPELGYVQLVYVPQLFYKKRNNELRSVAVNLVTGSIIISSLNSVINELVTQFSMKYKVRTVLC